MSKQLRLDVAQLTDVGRKRPHNEDNMAYVIPKDAQIMAKKGALFIVADGMGGHAAGEVASEIAVDTVSNVYYEDDSEDIAVSLLHAIKRANSLIHQRAAENMLRSGMGTTCVSAVLRGNMAYFANVGDSRAYLIRGGQVKQVSQDHSWVEEQVRAGLLTRDQARSHAQRNVITRSLGTQPDVEIDIFAERLEEGDSMILCSDGLSGLVDDEDLRSIVDQYVPQESVYHLVERANENGGPDNITAIVIKVLEVGMEEPPSSLPGVLFPVPVGGREADGAGSMLKNLPHSAIGLPTRPEDNRLNGSSLRISSGPLGAPGGMSSYGATPQQSQSTRVQAKRNRLFYTILAVFILLVLAGAGAGVWYFMLRPQHTVNVDGLLKDANVQVEQANKILANDPATALKQLSQAQSDLKQLQEVSLSDAQHNQASGLHSKLVSTTKTAITNYNQLAAIVPLAAAGPCVNATNSPLDSGTTGTQANILAVIQNGKNKQFFYAVGADQKLYRLNDQRSFVNKISAVQDVLVQAVVSDGQRLVALASQPKDNSYALHLLLPNDDGTLKDSGTATVDQKYMQNGLVPQFVAAWGQDVYVILTSKTAPNTADMLHYKISGDNQWEKATPVNATLSISNTLVSVAAFPDGRLFLLYSNGDVQTLQFANGGNLTAVSVVMQSAIPVPLSATAADFSPTSAVPTPGTQGVQAKSFLSVPGASMLAAGLIDSDNAPHLFILDKDHFRVIDLKVAQEAAMTATVTPSASPTSSTGNGNGGTGGGTVSTSSGTQLSMTLVRQYTSANLLAVMKSAVADPHGASLYLLTQSAQSNATPGLISIDMHQQNDQQSACASS
ncbi:Stp1/IreP family PP2C-type Ser/Thr phosphatase [Ktedonosporobacter rubrisoli]|uniref:Stp1/IreP family PP2C-type Ser/Thr phosphatase n=1 Tax=Ktedonosporobacter rubrisoli TaxID=2509675 RepID=A0A4P6JT30_KTERU|nr:Stp1/IreP family PP2C-type Ser/Thr phosphatase [Ktedonosporobacter rubrisoli]QBD78443.1 Stp1/IreP family PP2C-type Ser/Thr phosphatase [Ktedonosporobacter rubrisoli]